MQRYYYDSLAQTFNKVIQIKIDKVSDGVFTT